MALDDKIKALQEKALALTDNEVTSEDTTTVVEAEDTAPAAPVVQETIDLGGLFEGAELTEEFKTKATTIFESAVAARLSQERTSLEEEYATRFLEESEVHKEGLIEKIDGYLDFMVEQWIKNNNVALERGIKAEIFESFVSSMHDVFVTHNINLPDEDFDLVESTLSKTSSLEEALDEQIAQNIELNKLIKQYAKDSLIKEHSDGMTSIDAEKFALLSEEVQFDDAESFVKKLTTIRENYVTKYEQKTNKQLTEDVTQNSNVPVEPISEEKKVDPAMASYLTALRS